MGRYRLWQFAVFIHEQVDVVARTFANVRSDIIVKRTVEGCNIPLAFNQEGADVVVRKLHVGSAETMADMLHGMRRENLIELRP